MGSMCPRGLATLHPTAYTLLDNAMKGCPARAGRPWLLDKMVATITKGPKVSAFQPQTMTQLQTDVAKKEAKGTVRLMLWEDLTKTPPKQLKT